MRIVMLSVGFGALVVGCSFLTSVDDLHPTYDASSALPDASKGVDSSDVSVPPPDAPCIAESDPNFCTRIGKSCELVTALDNCGVSRTVNSCGLCTGASSACVANVCTAPVCGGDYGGNGTPLTDLAINGAQAALMGVSATGASVLFLRYGVPGCLGNGTPLNIADSNNVNLPTQPKYAVQPIGSLAAFSGMTRQQQTMTLFSDGLTIVGVGMGYQTFLESTRSKVGLTDFTPAAAGSFNTINGGVPAGGQLSLPAISADGLSFYYQLYNAQIVGLNGIYEATRAQTNQPFNAGVQMPAIVQNYSGVTGVSSDRMTLFVTKGFGTTILSRTSLSQPYAVSTIVPPTAAFRVVPTSTCGFLFGTCEPGGCGNETICVWAKH